jgi:hypothetical protein
LLAEGDRVHVLTTVERTDPWRSCFVIAMTTAERHVFVRSGGVRR